MKKTIVLIIIAALAITIYIILPEAESDKSGSNGFSHKTSSNAGMALDSIFGLTMSIPVGLTSYKVGKDFIWLSDNGISTNRNICVYSASASITDYSDLIRLRDSIMRINIIGEKDYMYMATAKKPEPRYRLKNDTLIVDGMWQMEGDAMGGPFWCITKIGICPTIVAEAFVFAPGKDKTEIMRPLAASLLTLKRRQPQKKRVNMKTNK